MKKTLSTAAAMLLIGISMSYAQSNDTTKAEKKNQGKDGHEFNTRANKLKNMTKIQPIVLPSAVITTLKASDRYAGWQKSPMFRTMEEDMYVIKIVKGGDTIPYMFRSNGKLIQEK